ncbi:dynein light chain [Plasmopara halstedii]|uniref:Dynein light chain n=1 Tax=Plasmopara halstedii TaxID=4781 RepID=A0A0P1B1F2_PLAHL|nr:dynein light chain [Plasmopara halstedii]CEG48516.1 dynein light chain [Plasmopara halstedii]|eukprot:XP_024584885.1 dynein light chain [Plasmopara halstedii]
MSKEHDICSYKARRTFLGKEFEIQLFEVDGAGITAVAIQISQEQDSPQNFSRAFSRAELEKAGINRTSKAYVALVDSLELVEDVYFTGNDAISSGQNMLTAYRLSSKLPGISSPLPIVSHHAALSYFARAPVGFSARNTSQEVEEDNLLVNVIVKGLTELCREKPSGLNALRWLGNWFLEHNPAQPLVNADD